jgi:cytochrome c551/c552
MKTVKATPDGFEIEFTKPVSKTSAQDFRNYDIESFIYKYHPVYGSPPVAKQNCVIKGIKISDDGLKVRLLVDGLRQYFIHTIKAGGLKDLDNKALLHNTAYYTLNNIPTGEKLEGYLKRPANLPVKVTATPAKSEKMSTPDDKTVSLKKAPTLAEVKPLLEKNTCLACHNADKRMIGPAYKDIAKRKYTDEQIVELIYKPNPKNWPDHATEMAAMPQVPRTEALKIAAWINSLQK